MTYYRVALDLMMATFSFPMGALRVFRALGFTACTARITSVSNKDALYSIEIIFVKMWYEYI